MAWIYLKKHLRRDFDGGDRQPVVLLHLAPELGYFSRAAAPFRLFEPAQIVHQASRRIPGARRFVETQRFAGAERGSRVLRYLQVALQYLVSHRTHRGASWASGAAQAAQFVRIILVWRRGVCELVANGGSFFVASVLLPLAGNFVACLLYTSPSPRDKRQSRMPSSA